MLILVTRCRPGFNYIDTDLLLCHNDGGDIDDDRGDIDDGSLRF